ncbi:MAG: SRPBCC family protein [Myxococcaceae bacterium]
MRALFVVTLSTALLARAEPVQLPTLTDAEKKKLDAGEVVVHELKPTDGRGVSGRAMAVIDAPSNEVWPIARDCEHFSKFLPETKTSRKTLVDGDTICFDELSLPFPLTNLWAETKTVAREEPTGYFHRDWSFVKGTYKRNRGAWTVVPWGEKADKSLVIYFVDSDPAMAVPDFILRAAQVGSLPKIFTGIKKRLADLRKTASSTAQ